MALTAKKVYALLKNKISNIETQIKYPIRYKGTVASDDLLPSSPTTGDMYNIVSKSVYGDAYTNVVYNGEIWEAIGEPVNISSYVSKTDLQTALKNKANIDDIERTYATIENLDNANVNIKDLQSDNEVNKTNILSLKSKDDDLENDLSNKADKTHTHNINDINSWTTIRESIITEATGRIENGNEVEY